MKKSLFLIVSTMVLAGVPAQASLIFDFSGQPFSLSFVLARGDESKGFHPSPASGDLLPVWMGHLAFSDVAWSIGDTLERAISKVRGALDTLSDLRNSQESAAMSWDLFLDDDLRGSVDLAASNH